MRPELPLIDPSLEAWRLSAVELAAAIRERRITSHQAATSVLSRIAEVNPRIHALADVMHHEALAAADVCDRALAAGLQPAPLHGVPVTVKVNVDTGGHATTDGIVAQRDNVAASDSPVVANLRAAGAVIVGRSNTPAFSLRWFTDNDLHGRTLNPFDAGVTPGGSSGGAAAAVSTGMGPIAHGNDYGGSIRYPAWACGVVGLRTTVGRVPSYKASSPERTVSHQWMSVQGPLTRTVADARLALQVMSRGSPLDPQWVDAPLHHASDNRPLRVAVFKRHAAFDADPGVVASVERCAGWLAAAGCRVEEAEPPHFAEAAHLWRELVMDDLRWSAQRAIQERGDAGVRSALAAYLHGLPSLDRDRRLQAQMRRFAICRDWSVFLDRYDVLLMPVSWQRQFRVDADRAPPHEVQWVIAAQSPLLATAMTGLPGLAVPTGLEGGLPSGVQLVATRFREDRCLQAGEIIERAGGFSVLDAVPLARS
jgi:amidase